MIIERSYEIRAPPEIVWDYVIDPKKIGNCLPDLRNLELLDQDRFGATVRVGVGFIKGDFKFLLEISDKEPARMVRLKGRGSGSGSVIDMDTTLELKPTSTGTLLLYRADVKVGGVMASLGQRMMEGATDKALAQVFECVKTAVEK